ncbi:MAG TPA: alpha/beta hydrolase [Acidimicrobiales bacterium]|nr:alpha/beta hydrolase [Acidimicrobiales bacterium]
MSRDDVTVALVHGCTQGPSGWDRVRELLSDSGVHSVAIDIDPREFSGATSRECSSYIAGVLENRRRVVLVGTSCSGLIIPVVSMYRPIDHLVFVCAGLPDVGRSATDQILGDGLLHEEWMKQSDYDSPEAATRFMFNDCEGDTLDWSLSTVRLFVPQLVYDEVTPLESWPDVPSTYLLGTKDRIISQEWARAAVPARLGGRPIELETGHCPQNSSPDAVADILAGVADSPR